MVNKLAVEEEVPVEEEEEEGPSKKKIKKEKDSYSRYPLPTIIGTKEYNEDDFCGLHIQGF